MDFMARICFLVPIVIVAGIGGEGFCWKGGEAGVLSAGGLNSGVRFGLGFLSFESIFWCFGGVEEEEGVCCTSPRSKKEFRGIWESRSL